ncbi:amino acid adenylation domain-containing protein [Paenibacillus sp. N1-5-1-14]|uniref:non-ribosomal peptide synthetase n=1 Tax=Paenibacillus radicibacter TaxID=2972488 RepID=UPI002158BB94|nr:non-ribosomal peptide synthetase [Paenibacillus radicibacter]MCR8643270.1 amino acid adenylation domain-containing protein [Paenibacillus radicibacter]
MVDHQLEGMEWNSSLSYWKKKLGGQLPVLQLPTDREQFLDRTAHVCAVKRLIPHESIVKLRGLSQQYGVSMSTILLAAYYTFLYRYCGETDLILGGKGLDRQTLVLRIDMLHNPTVIALLGQVHHVIIEAAANPATLEEIVQELCVDPRSDDTLLFHVMFVMGDEEVTNNENSSQCLILRVTVQEESLSVHLTYNSAQFGRATAERMVDHYVQLLHAMIDDPTLRVSELRLLSNHELELMLDRWNAHLQPLDDSELCIHEMFEEQAKLTPDAEALVDGLRRLTYRELDDRSNQVANYLRDMGIGPDFMVGIFSTRTAEMLIGMLGVLKAGGAYVPLDPAYPKDRIAFIMEDTGVKVVLTQALLLDQLPQLSVHTVLLEQDGGVTASASTAPIKSGVDRNHLAYVFFTSGSTGRPKGVALEHRSVTAFMNWCKATYSQEELAGVLASTSICFDLSVYELFVPLVTGGKVILVENALYLPELPARNEVTLINTVPSAMKELVRIQGVPSSVKTVNFCGEPLTLKLTQQVYAVETIERVYNLYGPSEDTTYSTVWLVERDFSYAPLIGRPILGTQCYILDSNLQPVPIGVAGELYLAGEGLARGYLNRPEQTAERFVDNPFAPGTRMYKTGDMCRYQADGVMEYVARMDNQVKFRGFRIELGEVETVLSLYTGVNEAILMVREDMPDDKRLVAYVTVVEGHELDVRKVNDHLKATLASYMIPSILTVLPAMPLTANGKIDRKMLPIPNYATIDRHYVEPRNEMEVQLAGIFTQVLGIEQVSVQDHFFQIGGHSLLMMQVISRIRNVLGVEISVRTFFEYATVAELAAWVESNRIEITPKQQVQITSINHSGSIPASFAQQRIWFLHQLDPSSSVYNITSLLQMKGDLDYLAVKRSIAELVNRQDSLRTTIHEVNGIPVQQIAEQMDIEVPYVNMGQLAQDEIHELARELGNQPFELSQGPLFRCTVVQVDTQEHYLIMVVHHIISDGWSQSLFIHELMNLYDSYIAGVSSSLPELPIQYADYAYWQQTWLQGEVWNRQLAYWKHQLQNAVPVLQLPTDRSRPAIQTFHGATVDRFVSHDLTMRLNQLSQQAGMTLFMTLLSAFHILLSRYSGETDILVGTPIANRNRTEIEGVIGFFVNTLVVRTDLSDNIPFAQLLERVSKVALEAYTHQDVPFEELVKELQPHRNLSHSPLFQVMFVMQSMSEVKSETSSLQIQQVPFDAGTSKFDLTLHVAMTRSGLLTSFEYNTDLFDRSTIERLARHYTHLLQEVVENPNQCIWEIPLLDEQERSQIVQEWNETAAVYSAQHVHDLIITKAEQVPDQIAVEMDDEVLTYQQLHERAERLSHFLRGQGVGPDVFVGICVERSPQMLVGILGILYAGGAYVPIDPTYPQERLAFVLEDSQVSVLLTQERLLTKLPEHKARTYCLDRDWQQIAESQDYPSQLATTADDLAYMIYTSGSTGKPKGVMVTHSGFSNYLEWAIEAYEVEKGIGSIVSTSLSFDATVTSLFAPLVTGGRVILLHEGKEIEELAQAFRKYHNLSVLKIAPAHLPLMSQQIAPEQFVGRVRTVVIGGEALFGENIAFWQQAAPETKLINEYGPTETVVGCCIYHAAEYKEGPVLIGRPIGNTQLYVLDAYMQPVPIGVAGELFIGGAGVARGYYNRAELTAERFVPNPFSTEQGSRLYKTGDTCRYLPDGNLQYIGRNDNQVKLRGYRIELGEIEALLLQDESVHEARVIVYPFTPQDKRLVAYITKVQGYIVDGNDVKQRLTHLLPAYMVPAHVFVLDEMPLTTHGKVDTRKFPAPNLDSSDSSHGAPRTPVEELLTGIFAEVLGVERIGIHDHFFENGGHSLLMMQVISRIRSIWNMELPVRALFAAPTVAELAEYVQAQGSGSTTQVPLKPVDRSAIIPASFSQQSLWFVEQLKDTSDLYNNVLAIRIRGGLNTAALESSVQVIIHRHEVLRTTFAVIEGQVIQIIADPVPIELIMFETSVEDVQQQMTELVQMPFDLNKGPLFRSHLLQMNEEEHVLVLTMHHIITDGWSMQILLQEIEQLYKVFDHEQPSPLDPLSVQYADYASWQKEWMQGEILQHQLANWIQILAGAPARLLLPTDYSRPVVQSYRGAMHYFSLSSETSTAIRELCRETGTTLFMTLMAAFQTLLYRESEQEDLVVGFPVANRNRSELESLLGYFVNMLPLRTDLSGNPSFIALLQQVRHSALEAYANQDVPFEKIVEILQPERSLSHSPIFQVVFALQGELTQSFTCNDVAFDRLEVEQYTSKYDLTLFMEPSSDQLIGSVEYSTDLFEASTIERLIAAYCALLEAVTNNPLLRLLEIPLRSADLALSEDELEELFN